MAVWFAMALYPRSIDDDFRSAISAFPSIVRSPGRRTYIYIFFSSMKGSYRFFLRFPRFRGIVKERGGNLRRSRIVDSVSIVARVYSFSRRKSKIMGGWKEQWVSEEASEWVLLQTFLLFLYFRGYKKIYIAIEINRRCKGNIGFTEKRFSL